MNPLSWLIYLADFMGSFNAITSAIMIVIVLVLTIAVVSIAYSIKFGENDPMEAWLKARKEYARWPTITPKPSDEAPASKKYNVWQPIKPLVITFLVVSVLNILAPSQETMYAIAASEVAEEILESRMVERLGESGERALDALDSINGWIEGNLEERTPRPSAN